MKYEAKIKKKKIDDGWLFQIIKKESNSSL